MQLLYLNPSEPPSAVPIVDVLTRRMAGALRGAKRGNQFLGFHQCSCGAISDTCDWVLPNGTVTNSLAVHYLAHHRGEVPTCDLREIASWSFPEEEPTSVMLKGARMSSPSEDDHPYPVWPSTG